MSEVIFDTCDAYGNPIGHPKEPLVNVLYNRLEVLKDGHNAAVRTVTTKIVDMDIKNLAQDGQISMATSDVQILKSEVGLLVETDKLILDMLEIFELRAVDAISAEETLRILRMRASPDEENHVMAANIIRNKRIKFGLPVADRGIEEKSE